MTGGGQRREAFTTDAAAAGERLDIHLARFLGVSRRSIKQALDAGRVFVDGRAVRLAGHQLQGGETVSITLEQNTIPPPPAEPTIVFRDTHLLVLDKPPGLPAHPTVAGRPDALTWATTYLSRSGSGTVPILLHRLDADTSGLLLFALTAEANRSLAAAFAERRMEKVYLALVIGSPPETFTVENFLRPGRRGRTEAVQAGGQRAKTDFRVLVRRPGFALVEARPKTGRTHQIRVHLAGEGFPLLGDPLYGGPTAVDFAGRNIPVSRHLLHAFRLSFRHPASNEPFTLEAPLPEDFQTFTSLCKRSVSPLPEGEGNF